MVHEHQSFTARLGKAVVFARWSLRGFYPVVRDETVVLHTGEQGVERALDHDQVVLLEICEHVRCVCFSLIDDHEDGILQDAFAHLSGNLTFLLFHRMYCYS